MNVCINRSSRFKVGGALSILVALRILLSAAGDVSAASDAGEKSNAVSIKGLVAAAVDPALRDKMELFGQFIGDWEIELRASLPDGSPITAKGEVHFGWILNGTAIQDVWSSRIDNPPPGVPAASAGTTIRFYDSDIDAWQVIWVFPLDRIVKQFVARKVGDDIVLENPTPSGLNNERWIYTDITPTSFYWRSEQTTDAGKNWTIKRKIFAHRVRSVDANVR
jgi:hypothetical protein